jgi:putative tryptophan/tyrosine transport system substrate-binding protein
MKRLAFALIVLLATQLAAEAQPAGKVFRVAVVFTTSPVSEMAGSDPADPDMRQFLRELRALGYVEGQNLLVERRSGEGKPDRYPAVMAEVISLRADVIVTVGNVMTQAAKQATSTIPIVMLSGDPLGSGLVSSLARPGGNLTGVSVDVDRKIEGKRLEVLKEAVPRVSRAGVIIQTRRDAPTFADRFRDMHVAAQSLGVTLLPVVVDRPEQFGDAPAALTRERADALIEGGSAFNLTHRLLIVEVAAKSRLPVISGFKEFVKAGGLMSYGTSVPDLWRRIAGYVNKILQGAKPADLPVEQPTKFELVVNLKTAKALGLTIPQSVLLRADEVIQ